MDPTELLKLLGIVIVVVGFALKLDSILIIMVAAIATAVVGGMDPVAFLDTLGESFVSNRSMCIFIMTFVLTGTLERNGLRQAAAALIRKLKNATSGIIISAYGLVRVAFAAFNINFGGVAGFIRPVIMPMAQAAVERDGNKIDEKHLEELKATMRLFTFDLLGLSEDKGGADSHREEAFGKVVDMVLDLRAKAKAAKDWATSDHIRDELAAAGFEVKDTKDGVTWRLNK